MSGKEKINWEEFKKKLEEMGYLETEKKSFFFKFSFKSLSFLGSLLRLSFLFSIISSFVISGIITIAISYVQKKPIPIIFLYYFPLFFIIFFGIILFINLIARVKPFKSPSLFAFYSSLILSIFCGLLIFINFNFLISKSFRFSSFFILIAFFFTIFFSPFKILSLLSWKEIPYKKFKKIYLFTFLILLVLSLTGLTFLFFKKTPEVQKNIAISSEYEKISVIGVDGLPQSEKIFKEIGLEETIKNSRIFNLKIKEYKSPPIFWTEVSTGFPPEINGFLNLKTYKLPLIKENIYPLPLSFIFEDSGIAKESISTSGVRKKRTFWEISSLFGRYALSLNWWASWEPLEQCELISNLYFIKSLKGEKGKEYKLLEPVDFENLDIPDGLKWNKFVFEALKKKINNQALITIYLPGLDVQIEDAKKGDHNAFFENSKYISENFKIIKDTIFFLIEKNYKIIFISYSGRNPKPWGWGFVYPDEKKLKIKEEISIYSLTPSILKILNLPISEKFPEKPFSIPFDTKEETYIRDYPPVEERGILISRPPIEELKSLGYLQ